MVIALINWRVFGDWKQVLFVQPRVGHRGRVFPLFKFRTMRAIRGEPLDSWSTPQDELRVTRFGRLLRNSHLDELPQLLNVARGEMSFIGPRPEMLEVESWACERIPEFPTRLAMRPGITGYAQVTQGYTGRDVEAYRQKLAINRDYINTVSLRTDLAIVARTALWMARGRGWQWKLSTGAAQPSKDGVRASAPTVKTPRR